LLCWRPRGPSGAVRASLADYLDAALLLFVIPLLSPQGWDYVLLVATPAVMLLLDRLEEFPPAAVCCSSRRSPWPV